MNLLKRELFRSKSDWDVNVGDVVELVYEDHTGHWKIRRFTGICISLAKSQTRYTLRNVFNGIPVEISFDASSSSIISFSKTGAYKPFSLKRGKLFYLRRSRLVDSKV